MIIQKNNPYSGPSFSLQNRLARLAWCVVCALLIRPTPIFMHGWRNTILRLFGAQIGHQVHIHANVKIWAPWNLHVGSFVGIGDGVNLYCMDKITIEDYAVISQGAHLCAGSHNFNDPSFQLITAPILIGAHAWVCADVFIGMGVVIPEGVVLGARALVSKSITEDWTVWGGMPAKKIEVRDRECVLGLK